MSGCLRAATFVVGFETTEFVVNRAFSSWSGRTCKFELHPGKIDLLQSSFTRLSSESSQFSTHAQLFKADEGRANAVVKIKNSACVRACLPGLLDMQRYIQYECALRSSRTSSNKIKTCDFSRSPLDLSSSRRCSFLVQPSAGGRGGRQDQHQLINAVTIRPSGSGGVRG
jgi:hypothetical protein